jgi:ABC-type Fe3+ transport system substrate-binding protein
VTLPNLQKAVNITKPDPILGCGTRERHAPHPHAAALFIDWALSEEGQPMITTFGRVVTRKGVKQRFTELTAKESLLVDVDFIRPILDQTGKRI